MTQYNWQTTVKMLYLCTTIIVVFTAIYSYSQSFVPQNRVMTIKEFKQVLNKNSFLRQHKQTVNDHPLSTHEIEMIKVAIKSDNHHYGGKCDRNRDIHNFTGSTLLVGGGKVAGKRGENDGKTILIDVPSKITAIKKLLYKLESGQWNHDPYIGKKFSTNVEKNNYINELKHKQSLYQEAFAARNNDILNRYYTLNIEKNVQPDMLASILSESDISKIPDNKFENVEFENVPCDVFLNPKLYPILARITKQNGTIIFSISNVCRRLIIPVIQSTKFGKEFIHNIKAELYSKPQELNSTYGSYNIRVTN